MKNFPHQHTSFRRFRAVLEAIQDLNARGEDANDDGALGHRLAIDTIHRFRGLDYTTTQNRPALILARLEEEELKPRSRQGARTAARENRKTLRHLGWLLPQGTELTIAGETLLSSAPGSTEEQEIIRAAVAQITLSDESGNISHPVLHLLHLITVVVFTSRDGMELALEAKDDTDSEFRRIEQLARNPELRQQTWERRGISSNRIANARKILPVFATKSGLMKLDTNGRFVLTPPGKQLLAYRTRRPAADTLVTNRPRYTARYQTAVTSDPRTVGQQRNVTAATLYTRSSQEQRAAAILLNERTTRHQTLVRRTAMHCSRYCRRREYYENASSYDLVIDSKDDNLVDLCEAKTIDNDAIHQIRRAIGQLLYYEYFVVSAEFPDRTIVKSIVVDRQIDSELAEFLDSLHIGLLMVTSEDILPQNLTGDTIARRLFSDQ